MLNLGVDVDIDVKKVHAPVAFVHKNVCVHCGGEGTLKFVDKFGRISSKEINAFDHIKCSKCGKPYSIEWSADESRDPDKLYPTAVEPDIKKGFMNIVKASKIKDKGEKEL